MEGVGDDGSEGYTEDGGDACSAEDDGHGFAAVLGCGEAECDQGCNGPEGADRYADEGSSGNEGVDVWGEGGRGAGEGREGESCDQDVFAVDAAHSHGGGEAGYGGEGGGDGDGVADGAGGGVKVFGDPGEDADGEFFDGDHGKDADGEGPDSGPVGGGSAGVGGLGHGGVSLWGSGWGFAVGSRLAVPVRDSRWGFVIKAA